MSSSDSEAAGEGDSQLDRPRSGPGGDDDVATILIVDDHPANLLAVQAVLEPLGHHLITAGSGDAALRCLLRNDVALILMDVQMPEIDGLQTTAIIKSRERTKHIPIIFLTAIHQDLSHVFLGYAHGAVDYLLKPIDPAILCAKVNVFVDLYRKEQQVKRQAERLRVIERQALVASSEQRYRNVTDAIPQCMWAARRDGEIYFCNRVWAEYTGLDLAASQNGGHLSAVHPEDRPELQRLLEQAVDTGQPFQLEYRLQRARDHEYRWHLAQVAPEIDAEGHRSGWICIANDVHDSKLASLALERARDEAETANQLKDHFLATVSHELRTPLNVVTGWATLLRRGKLDQAGVARAVDSIERSARAQVQLIDDLLDVSRIITGKLRLEFEPLSMATIVRTSVDSMRPTAEAKQVTLDLDVSVEPDADLVHSDPDRLQQIVWNLISNAIKFTPRGGRVTVSLARVDSSLELQVADTGMGIEQSLIPHVFDRFRQGDGSASRRHGGLGLGLSIVRHLVELHGGTVGVQSEGEGKGATFTIRLPVRALRVETEVDESGEHRTFRMPVRPEEGSSSPDLRGLDIVVVDDEADARELLTTVLSGYGAEVRTASSAQEALASLSVQVPDVVVSDIGMPDQTGYHLIKAIRSLPGEAGGQVPALALTAYARQEDQRLALAAGFQAHLAKPAEPDRLAQLILGLASGRLNESKTRRGVAGSECDRRESTA